MATQQQHDGATNSSNQGGDEPPLWRFVDKVEKVGAKGGTWKIRCNICKEERQAFYSRVRAHLLKLSGFGIQPCKKVTTVQMNEMKRLEDEFEQKKLASKPRQVPLPCETETEASLKRKRVMDNPAMKLLGKYDRDQVDQEIARMYYTGGLPFNLARNPHYQQSYTMAANLKVQGYIPPSYNRLRTTLLDQEREHVDGLLVPLKGVWKEKGVSVVTDGWSDPKRKPLINFMATSENGPLFLNAVNCFGEVKDKHFIAQLMEEAIIEVGHQNVVQIITDNAPNCKAAGEIIEGRFPHIYWTPCVVHTLNLALKNICAAKNVDANQETYDECSWITIVHDDALAIKHFIMNHNMRLAIFSKFSTLQLLSVADTRFASIIVMLKRMKQIEKGLKTMVISEEWSSYKDDDPGKASFVKEKILDDEWWEKVSYILDFTGSIYEMIRLCDTDKPCLHLVYEMWDSMIEKVKFEIYKKEGKQMSDISPFYDVVYDILIARWTKNNIPLHCLAHSLNPRFYSDEWLSGNIARVGPHKDSEISKERLKCFKRLFPNSEQFRSVMDEYAKFSMRSGPFGKLSPLSMMSTMEPMNWWVNFGADAPLLQTLAFKLLGQPTSSSCCERNWSTYGFIHSQRRNRLLPSRARDLVFIHNNLRLLARNSSEYEDKKTKMWDVSGDSSQSSDPLEDGGFLDFSQLTLDEPEFEEEFLHNI